MACTTLTPCSHKTCKRHSQNMQGPFVSGLHVPLAALHKGAAQSPNCRSELHPAQRGQLLPTAAIAASAAQPPPLLLLTVGLPRAVTQQLAGKILYCGPAVLPNLSVVLLIVLLVLPCCTGGSLRLGLLTVALEGCEQRPPRATTKAAEVETGCVGWKGS
jgi:hypothetical protein